MRFSKKLRSAAYLLLATLAGVLTGCDKAPVNPASPSSEFIVGTYAKDNEPGIYRIQLDAKSGVLSSLTTLANTVNPSYLAVSADQQTVFAVNETSTGGITVFNWQSDRNALLSVSQLGDIGDSPCYISLSPDGSMLAVANYMSGDIKLFNIKDNALHEFAADQHHGHGSNERQEAPHMHWINWSPDGRFIYAVDLGLDEVSLYQVEGDSLLPAQVAIKLQPADGPRHMVFSKNHNLAYLVTELSNVVLVLQQDQTTGKLTEIQRLSSLPADFEGKSQAAAIHLSPQEDFLYAANRGLNSIAVYAIDAQGKLKYIQDQDTGGNWPRDFIISNDGEFLLVANQLSNDISVLKRDTKTGLLSATKNKLAISQPTFVSQL